MTRASDRHIAILFIAALIIGAIVAMCQPADAHDWYVGLKNSDGEGDYILDVSPSSKMWS